MFCQTFARGDRVSSAVQDRKDHDYVVDNLVVDGEGESPGEKSVMTEYHAMNSSEVGERIDIGE
jgi:hypothetical protein